MSYIGNTLPANFQSLPAVQRFNGNASTTAFTLAAAIANDQSILVSVDGVVQDSNAYSVSGTTLTFTAAPSSGTGNIFVNTISPVGSTLVPPDGIAINATTGTFSDDVLIGTTDLNTLDDTSGTSAHLSTDAGYPHTFLRQTTSVNSSVFALNDTGSGGVIQDFRVEGSSVGDVRSHSGLIQFGQGNANLKFSNSADAMTPSNGSGSNNDGELDLGSTAARFKDLYLSSGIFLGGTGSANELDDYEEGIYGATISCASGSITLDSTFNELAYTKVGRVVHVQGFLKVGSVSSPTGATNLNLPFTAADLSDKAGVADNVCFSYLNGSAVTNGYYILFCELGENTANNRIFWDNNNQGNNIGDNVTATGSTLRMNFSYIAA